MLIILICIVKCARADQIRSAHRSGVPRIASDAVSLRLRPGTIGRIAALPAALAVVMAWSQPAA